ncbi:MAG: site-2 protease family protein [Actinobacteria bacterium]|nr:site-2 protease family protein [Actinomycetota bacterium]MCL5887560.1 site-2 protease family protein [Actinomycetota bacterium]
MAGILETLSVIFWGIVTFSILVVLHEGGHYAVARAFKVRVHEFMVGLPGPAIRYFSKSGTAFGITAVPLGGYVRIAGMEPGPEDDLLGPALYRVASAGPITMEALANDLGVDIDRAASLIVTLEDWAAIQPSQQADETFCTSTLPLAEKTPEELLALARSSTYRGLSTPKRIAVLAAGVFVNLFAAIAVFTFVLSVWGYYEHSLEVAEIVPDSAAAQAAIMPGDTILELDGVPVEAWAQLSTTIGAMEPGEELQLTYSRNGAVSQTEVILGESEGGRGFLGIAPTVVPVELSVVESFVESISWVGLVFVAIGNFFNPETFAASVEGARSIVGISVEVERAVEAGPLSYAWIVALLSLSLGAMNILPIPPLDGGKIVMEVVERVLGKPLGRRFTIGVSLAGFGLLLSLIGYLMYADIMRYFVNS